MTRKNTVIGMLLIITLIGASAVVWAFHSGSHSLCGHLWDHPGKGLISGKIGRMLVLHSELNITKDQKEQIRNILINHKAELVPLARSIAQEKRDLREAILAKKPDEKDIRAAADKLGKSIGDASLVASRLVAKARPILSADQIELLQKHRKEGDAAFDRWLKKLAK